MSKFTKSTTGESGPAPLDPATMTEDQLRAYVTRLETSLVASTAAQAKPAQFKDWEDGEKRWVMVPRTPTNEPLTINGKRYLGRCLVDRETWYTLLEMHGRAVQSELSRMQTRGNMVAPHQLPVDDVSSRSQPQTIASL